MALTDLRRRYELLVVDVSTVVLLYNSWCTPGAVTFAEVA